MRITPPIHLNDVSTPVIVILLAVRWYLRYLLAYEHVAETSSRADFCC